MNLELDSDLTKLSNEVTRTSRRRPMVIVSK